MAPFDRLADPNGISPAAVDAVGVGRREAFGVRQLAAALPYAQTTCLSPYRHPRGSSAGFGNRGLEQGAISRPRQNPGSKPKQRACHFIRCTPKGRTVVAALLAAREADTEKVTKLAA
ncbi:MAG: hypothetical protein GX456_04765 [Verrucomicrobia bacterium]|nr:hypothetical protein [Verrucomicrobiota bacterium]